MGIASHLFFEWSDANVEALKSLWADNYSCSQIGAKIGATRNAVIGKVHRLGLSGRIKRKPLPPRHRKPRAPVVSNRPPSWMSVAAPPLLERAPPPEAPPTANNVSIVDLEPHHCRWPMGEPGADMPYCGEPRVYEASAYCAFHRKMAYQPRPQRERDTRTPFIPRRAA